MWGFPVGETQKSKRKTLMKIEIEPTGELALILMMLV
jgi:hypothetical protein